MSLHSRTKMRGRTVASRALLLVIPVFLVALTAAAQTASGTAQAVGKPVIGKAVTTPLRPVAGERFTVSFRVTRSGTGLPLTRGKMICDPSIAGKVIRHAESFRRGTARLSFVMPANSAGRQLKVKVTIRAGSQSATRVAAFRVQGTPSLSIGDVSAVEGNGGSTKLAFPVTLSSAATKAVSVGYATANGTASSSSDFAAASGTLTFGPGENAKTISVDVAGDTVIEQDETFTITLSSPVNATIADGTATGTIRNDDTAAPVTAGAWKGATQEGNYVFFTVTASRTVTALRINALPCLCEPGGRLDGAPDFGDTVFPIGTDGTFGAEDTWTGSDVIGDIEWTYEYVKITGRFDTATAAAGTLVFTFELKYKGTHYRCSSGEVKWSATLQS